MLPSDLGDLCARSDTIELELLARSCLRYSAEHHRHVLSCERCTSLRVLSAVMEALVTIDLRLFQARFRLLHATQRLDNELVNRLLDLQTAGRRENWRHAAELFGWLLFLGARPACWSATTRGKNAGAPDSSSCRAARVDAPGGRGTGPMGGPARGE
jgi:hypothetical protein